MIQQLMFVWVVFGIATGVFFCVDPDGLSSEARVCLAVGIFAMFPVLVLAGSLFAVFYLLPRTLYRGVRDLRAHFMPARNLPTAKVVRK